MLRFESGSRLFFGSWFTVHSPQKKPCSATLGRKSKMRQKQDQEVQKIKRDIQSFLKKNGSRLIVEKYARYFKEGYDPYGVPPEKMSVKTKEWFKTCQEKLSIRQIVDLCEGLMKSGKYEETSTAIVFMRMLKEHYNKSLFNAMGRWFEKYIKNWAHCDGACSEVLYPFIEDKIVDFKDLLKWTDSSSKWKRRAVPVTLVTVVSKTGNVMQALQASRKLILDSERVVHQGVGWLLRETWKKSPKKVEDFLYRWKDEAPRLVIQYATEKIDKQKRKRFRRE
jgi:3-methyladenine DNA glycosylase AlkD